jgi:gluconolactonase
MNGTSLWVAGLILVQASVASAQSPASAFDRGRSLQSWQDPGLAAVQATCRTPPPPFAIGGAARPEGAAPAPPAPEPPAPPATIAIPGVVAAGQAWKTVWQWQGNNADGLIADRDGQLLFANNDASNVMRLDPATGLAAIVHADTNTGGAVARSKSGALFLVARGLGGGVLQLEPRRRMVANRVDGEPLECVGGVLNDLVVDARDGVYVALTGPRGGVFHAGREGVLTKQGPDIPGANGIVLSADEKTLYVTSRDLVLAFDLRPDGSLSNLREFAKLRGGQGGDGSAIDAEGRLYVSTGRSVDVFSAGGDFLGSIAGPQGLHGVAFGGRDKKTLFAIVFEGGWGTPGARNRIIAMPMLAQGYLGRAK